MITATIVPLVSFDANDDRTSQSDLVADTNGDLFGTAPGGADNDGVVFEVFNTTSGYANTPTLLFTGNSSTNEGPYSLSIDSSGNLFGTSQNNGTDTDGTVFEIANTPSGYAATPIVLANFNGTDGSDPTGALIEDSAGDLFGTTSAGGANTDGTVFEVTNTGFVTCYRRGTRIATPAGERAVESLTEGDLVVTATGELHEIVWIGCRRVDCRLWDAPENVWPVRVRAGAFGEGLPHRDLFLSPDHAVFVDGAPIPIRNLISGGGITQIKVDEVVYYHMELAEHDLLLAEGLPAESYLDTGDRFVFENSSQIIGRRVDIAFSWETTGCASLLITGPDLRKVRRHVGAIAARTG